MRIPCGITEAVMVAIRDVMRVLVGFAALPGMLVRSSLASDESCSRRSISVTVADRNWAPVTDLKPDDFQGEFRGKAVKILSVVADTRPHRIVIILDSSGSLAAMERPGKSNWRLARELASHLAESKPRETTFALLIFNDKVTEQIDFSQGPGAVAERLRQIGADPNYQKTAVKGRTALWDTVLAAQRLLHDSTSADVLYLVTDGGEDASRASATDVRRGLAANSSRVFISLLVSPLGHRNRTPEEVNAPEEMSKIARATGGAIFGPVMQGLSGPVLLSSFSDEDLTFASALRHFYESMLVGYHMEVELPGPVDKWRDWKLELSKERQRQLKGSQLGYTQDLAPCRELPN